MDTTPRERPIQYPTPPKKPEMAKDNVTDAAALPQAAPAFPRYDTHMRLYVQETGEEMGIFSGTMCEIRGGITANGERRGFSVNLKEKTNFAGENNGLGRLVCDFTKRTALLPANFKGVIYEEGQIGVGDRYFTNASVDWNTAPEEWANGRAWWFSQSVSNDDNFKGHLWWRVTKV